MIIFHQGDYREDGVTLRVSDPVFRYGVGVFETLLYNGRILCHPEAHIQRLTRSLDVLGFAHALVDLPTIATRLLNANGLVGHHARVNLFYIAQGDDGTAHPLVATTPYVPLPDKRFSLALSRNRIRSMLLSHKTMNAMTHHLERRDALRQGCDDAVLLGPGKEILETTTASLIFFDGREYVTPASRFILPGTTLALADAVVTLHHARITAKDLGSFVHAYVCNSLIGAKPVTRIDQVVFEPDWSFSDTLTRLAVNPDVPA